MTDKEKARAYDEALDRCKEWASGTCGQSVNNSPKDVAEFIFPQLAESEDERIIEEIKFAVMQMPSSRQDTKNRCLAYLEKQKPMYNLEIPAGDVASAEEDSPFDEDEFLENELSAFLQNYDKEYDDDAAVSDVAKHFYEIGKKQKEHQNKSDAREKALGRDLTFPQDKDKNLDEIAQDYVDGVKEFNPEPTWDLMQTAVCYGYHYCEQKEQEPAWSEEDEIMIGSLINYFEGDALDCSLDCVVNWLKSLRPSWRPSEQEKGALRTAIYVLTEERNFPKAAKQLQAILDVFDGKGSRKDWKPSDEQLRPLEYAIDYFKKKRNDTTYLESLYNDLKKLT